MYAIQNEVIQMVLIHAVPSAPVELSAHVVNETAVILNWSPPDSPNGIILFYEIKFYGYKTSEDDSTVYFVCLTF